MAAEAAEDEENTMAPAPAVDGMTGPDAAGVRRDKADDEGQEDPP